jgi:hypothetical protein
MFDNAKIVHFESVVNTLATIRYEMIWLRYKMLENRYFLNKALQ